MSSSVPTGTVAPPPPAAVSLFGPRLPLVQRYADLLAGMGVTRGLIGPRETGRIWDRHILNCAVVIELIPLHSKVLDLGSGAGLPGIVLALARPDLDVVLIEPMLRRVEFLSECLDALELDAVTVQRARAEEVANSMQADLVTARAVAPLRRLVKLAMPLLQPGGRLLALKGTSAVAELAESADALGRAGAGDAQVVVCGVGVIDPPTRVVSIRRKVADAPAAGGAAARLG